ncbi:flavin reductase family protein [Aeromicrobium panaciterrae]
MTVPAEKFRATLGHFASGVVVVTGLHDGAPRGLACQSFFSLSLDPPLVAVAVAHSSTSWADIQSSGAFGINVLHSDQFDVCQTFGRSGGDKFAEIEWVGRHTGSPRIDGSLAWIDCTIQDVHQAGDHLLVVGRVEEVQVGSGAPLLFYRGRFGELHKHAAHGAETNLDNLISGLRQGWG